MNPGMNPGKRTRTRRGLVLGTGGSLGYAWTVAALSTWQQATGHDAREADVIVGTSAGSIVASALASGIAVDDLVEHLLHPQPTPDTPRPRRRGARGGLPPLPRFGPGSIPTSSSSAARPASMRGRSASESTTGRGGSADGSATGSTGRCARRACRPRRLGII